MNSSDGQDWLGPHADTLKKKLDHLLGEGKVSRALKLLDSVVDSQMPLFDATGVAFESGRQFAWLYKINLLRSLGRHMEALAWTCLECELNPDNATSHAMKEQLKAKVRRHARSPDRPGTESSALTEDLWAGVAGMRELKAILERDVILPFQQPDVYRRYRISLPNGVLLYGPPGCGKTYIAEKLGQILGFHVISVKPSDLGSPYVHGTQKAIGALFQEARKHRPCLIFLDELDALIPDRAGDHVGHHYAAEVNEFLTQLNKAAEQRILVVGATNCLDKIDSAALRPGRFDKKVLVGPPDMEARVELLKLYLKDRPQEFIDLLKLAIESEGASCAEIEYIVTEAARRALIHRRTICTEDVMAALADNPPVCNKPTCQEP
ncbi:MAG TPA: ATP-binding protein [Phycisphaerae bacterium]|nr:ATP-binding protein [Phycisphaerae bacterium]